MTLTATSPLTATDERALVALAQGGDHDAIARIVTSQLNALNSTAYTYGAASGVDRADLVSAGIEALLAAIHTFDPERGTRLFTHAQHGIREAMADEVAAYSSAIAIPGRTLRRYRRALRETTTLAEARALAKTRDGMDESTFDAVHAALTGGHSLDAGLTSGGPNAHGTAGSDCDPALDSEARRLGDHGPTPEASAVTRALTRQALAVCQSDTERLIVTRAFGLDGGESLGDERIAQLLGTSRTTVLRTRNAVLTRMRAALA